MKLVTESYQKFVNESLNETFDVKPDQYIKTEHGHIYKRVMGTVGGQPAFVGVDLDKGGKMKIGKRKTGIHSSTDYKIISKKEVLDELGISENLNEFGPMAGSGNRNYSTNELVDRIGKLDKKLMNNRRAEREWEDIVQNYLDGEEGSSYWTELSDRDLENAIQDAEHLMKKYRISESVNEARKRRKTRKKSRKSKSLSKSDINKVLKDAGVGFVKMSTGSYSRPKTHSSKLKGVKGGQIGPMTVTSVWREKNIETERELYNTLSGAFFKYDEVKFNPPSGDGFDMFIENPSKGKQLVYRFRWSTFPTYAPSRDLDPSYQSYWLTYTLNEEPMN